MQRKQKSSRNSDLMKNKKQAETLVNSEFYIEQSYPSKTEDKINDIFRHIKSLLANLH